MRCDDCHPLLLDHLYGLLDPAEAAAVERHLTGCPACVSASARAKGLFARAAKSAFPHVRFAAPADDAALDSRPVPSTLVPPAAVPRRGSWVPWAVAACVLALIPGALIPLTAVAGRFDRARLAADDSTARVADARLAVEGARADAGAKARTAGESFAAAKQRTDAVLTEWVAAEKAADAAATDRPTARVTRPLAAQPGAPAELAVALTDPAGTLRGKRVEAEVRDEAGTVLFTQRIDPARPTDAAVRVPADVWAKLAPQAELFLAVAATDEATGTRTDIQDRIRLSGPVYATMLVTDRAAYRPGERVHFRSLTLDRVTFRPPAREQVLHFALLKPDNTPVAGATLWGTTSPVRATDGGVEPVVGADGTPVRGVGCGAFVLPAELPDGDYRLTLTELPGRGGNPPAVATPVVRTIRVRAGATEKYAKTLTFKAASFAPGQKVEAVAAVTFQGRPLAGADVTAIATADGKPSPIVRVLAKKTGADGKAAIVVVLPPAAEMPRGDVRLLVTVRTPDATESVAEVVPVAGRDVLVEFFPEGGTLVAGVPNRVYVRATTPAGRPVEIRGTLAAGNETVAKVESATGATEPGANRGTAVVTFTPKADAAYRLKLDGRAGDDFALPPAVAGGVAMTVLDPVTAPGRAVRVRLASPDKARNLVVGAYTRGRLADTRRVTVAAGATAEVALLATPDPRGGVTRITVFEQPTEPNAGLVPVAERLVFRTPGETLNLALTAGKPAPDGAVDLAIAATDEAGRPAAAILWAAAVDAASAPGATERALPTHFLLAGEVQTPDDLEYADFLLTDHPAAAAALDGVLATQGWRRFVEQAAPKKPDAERLLVLNGQYPVTDAAPARDHRRLYEAFWPRYEAAAKELDAVRKARAAAIADRSADPTVRQFLANFEEQRRDTADRTAEATAAAEPLAAVRRWESIAAGALGAMAAAFWFTAFTRAGGVRAAAPLLVAVVGAGGLAIFLALDASNPIDLPEPDAEALTFAPDGEPATPVPGPAVSPPVGSPDPRLGDPVVKGPSPEPRILSTVGDPVTPPKLPAVGARPVELVHPIPDDLLRKDRPTGSSRPAPSAAPTDADRRAAERAAAFATARAVALAIPIESLLPAGKGDASADRVRASVSWAPPLLVREYAAPRPGTTSATADAGTVLWQPLIVLPADGKTTLHFHTGTAAGGYRVVVAGHTPDGRLGSARLSLPAAPE